jgi:hypothetical protein
MENDAPNYDALDITNAGGSTLAALVYTYEYEGRHSVRQEIDSGPFTLTELNENPNLGGGFFAAVWRGDYEDAYARADSNNREILESVGTSPVGADYYKA